MKKSKSGFWICVLPALICFAMVVLIPAITGLLYSFTDWNGMNKPVSFAGLENYRGLCRAVNRLSESHERMTYHGEPPSRHLEKESAASGSILPPFSVTKL